MYSVYFNNENVANSLTYIGALWKIRKLKCDNGTEIKIEQTKVILKYIKNNKGIKNEV